MEASELTALQTLTRADGEEFPLGGKAHVSISGETGDIVGLAVYGDSAPSALLHYKNAQGRAVSEWWPLSRLTVGFPPQGAE